MAIDLSDVGFFNNLKAVKNDWEDWEWAEIDWFRPLSRGVTIIDGDPGAGKSTIEALIAYKCQKYFGQQVVVDNPTMLRPAFGPHQLFDIYQMIENLKAMAKLKGISMNLVLSRYMDDLFRSVGVDPYYKTFLIDEAHKIANKRRGMSHSTIIIGQLARQIRHYGSLLMLSSQQAVKNLDQNEAVSFATCTIQCSYDQMERVSYYAIKSKFTPQRCIYPMRVNPDNWKDIYESFCPAQPGIPAKN